jgi:hypothetical protein
MKHTVSTPFSPKLTLINPELLLSPTPVILPLEKTLNSLKDAMFVIKRIAISYHVSHVQPATILLIKPAAS